MRSSGSVSAKAVIIDDDLAPFGQSTQVFNNYLGSGGRSGGLNPLYQIGGPSFVQLALKVVF